MESASQEEIDLGATYDLTRQISFFRGVQRAGLSNVIGTEAFCDTPASVHSRKRGSEDVITFGWLEPKEKIDFFFFLFLWCWDLFLKGTPGLGVFL